MTRYFPLISTLLFFTFNYLHSDHKELPTYSLTDSKGTPLDHKLVELFSKRGGIFIEVGAFDGVCQSNTKLLEDEFNWHGILIEASPILFESIIKNRPNSTVFQCGLGSFEENNTYAWGDFGDGITMSSIDGKRLGRLADTKILMRSLQAILDEEYISHVNFFSLDVEGHELSILRGIDFERTTFDYILVEIYPAEYDPIVNLLLKAGYKLVCNFSNYNKEDNLIWDGQHNDFLFSRCDMVNS